MYTVDVVFDLPRSSATATAKQLPGRAEDTDQEMNVATVKVVLRMPLDLLDGGLWGEVTVSHGGGVGWKKLKGTLKGGPQRYIPRESPSSESALVG